MVSLSQSRPRPVAICNPLPYLQIFDLTYASGVIYSRWADSSQVTRRAHFGMDDSHWFPNTTGNILYHCLRPYWSLIAGSAGPEATFLRHIDAIFNHVLFYKTSRSMCLSAKSIDATEWLNGMIFSSNECSIGEPAMCCAGWNSFSAWFCE